MATNEDFKFFSIRILYYSLNPSFSPPLPLMQLMQLTTLSHTYTHSSIYIPASHNPQTSSALQAYATRGRRGGRDRVNGGRRLVRRIPSCRRCRIRGSARWGGRGTSVRENKVSVRVWRRKEGTGEMHGEPDGDVGVGGAACTAAVLLVAEGLDHNWVVHCTCGP